MNKFTQSVEALIPHIEAAVTTTKYIISIEHKPVGSSDPHTNTQIPEAI